MSCENPTYASPGAGAQSWSAPARDPKRPFAGLEKRRHPRLAPRNLWMTVGLPTALRLVERHGETLALRSDTPLQPGQRLLLDTEPERHRAAEVMACRLEEGNPALLEVHYRIDCRLLGPDA